MNNNNKNGGPEIGTLHITGSLAKTILNSLSANIAILDEYGVILETNQAWRNYATENKMEGSDDSIGVNYLELCDMTTGKEAKYARDVAAGIRSVIKCETKEFLYDYPCRCSVERLFTISFAIIQQPAPAISWRKFSTNIKSFGKRRNLRTM